VLVSYIVSPGIAKPVVVDNIVEEGLVAERAQQWFHGVISYTVE
jgi:hypothetical protein